MIEFGKAYNKINRRITEDYISPIESKDKQVAIILKLIMDCHFRVGNERYSKTNKSYGTTTLEKVAGKISAMPESYFSLKDYMPTESFINYASPLIGDSLPLFERLVDM